MLPQSPLAHCVYRWLSAATFLLIAAIWPGASSATCCPGSAIAGEFRVNSTTAGNQTDPGVAMDARGNFVVVWESELDAAVFGQRYNAAGSATGAEFTVAAGAHQPVVAMDAAGNFIVAMRQVSTTTSGEIVARRFDAQGAALGGPFAVNTFTAGDQREPAIAVDADGDFVVAWQSEGQDGNDWAVIARRYDAAGVAKGPEFVVNTFTQGGQKHCFVSVAPAGGFVVSWASTPQDGSFFGVYGQRFDAAGARIGNEFRVNQFTERDQARTVSDQDAAGGIVQVWASATQDGDNLGIYARRYDAAGTALEDEFRVNTFTAGAQTSPAVGMDVLGRFAVIWYSEGQDGSGGGVYGQRYDAAAVPAGDEFRINEVTAGNQGGNGALTPFMAMDADGDFVAVWVSDGQDGSGLGIYARRYASPDSTDLRVRLSGGPDPVAIGERANFTVIADNLAPAPALSGDAAEDAYRSQGGAASGVSNVFTFNGPGQFRNVVAEGWQCSGTGPVSCALTEPLAAGAQATYRVSLDAGPGTGTLSATAEGSTDAYDANAGNDVDTASLAVFDPCAGRSRGTLVFAAGVMTVTEGIGMVQVSVARGGDNCGAASVNYRTQQGTARTPADYTTVQGTLNWADGDSGTRSFDVPIVGDSLDEATQTFQVLLTAAEGAGLGTPSLATIRIQDDDESPVLTLSRATQSVSEGAIGAVRAELSAPSERRITVTLALGGTASAGSDYTAPPISLSFNPGRTAITLRVATLDDAAAEQTETVTCRIDSAVNASIGSAALYTLNIVDTD